MGKGNEKWRALSAKEPGGVLETINDDVAQDLLDAMVKDSAFAFSAGVEHYVIAERKLKKAKKSIEQLLADDEEKRNAFEQFLYAIEAKQSAVRAIKNEYLFLNGGRNVKPPIDGKYVMVELIKTVLGEMDDELFNDAMNIVKLHRTKRKKK